MKLSQATWKIWSHQCCDELGERRWVETSNGPVSLVELGWGQPLLIVPGLAGTWKSTIPLARRLARSHRVSILDLRDSRRSEVASWSGSLDGETDVLMEVLQDWPGPPPIVCGITYGGWLAMGAAIAAKSQIAALVLYGGVAAYPNHSGVRFLRRLLESREIPNTSPFLNQFFQLLDIPGEQRNRLVSQFRGLVWETDQTVVARRLAAVEHIDYRDQLWNLDVPTLVIAGDRDLLIPSRLSRELARDLPDGHYDELSQAGHLGFLSHAQRLTAMTTRFVQRQVFVDQ